MNNETPGKLSDWRVECGDALDLLRSIETATVDAVITDPPYSSGGLTRGDRMVQTRTKYQSTDAAKVFESFTGDNRDQRGFAYWCALWLSECQRVAKPGAMIGVFSDWRQLPTVTDLIQSGGWVWRGIVPWDKAIARPVAGRFRSQAEYLVWGTNGPRDTLPTEDSVYGGGIIRVATTPTDEREHSTQKPVELLEEIIRVASPAGGLVLDPFLGSGTTGVACIQQGRRFIGFEKSTEFCEIARRRLSSIAPLFQQAGQ